MAWSAMAERSRGVAIRPALLPRSGFGPKTFRVVLARHAAGGPGRRRSPRGRRTDDRGISSTSCLPNWPERGGGKIHPHRRVSSSRLASPRSCQRWSAPAQAVATMSAIQRSECRSSARWSSRSFCRSLHSGTRSSPARKRKVCTREVFGQHASELSAAQSQVGRQAALVAICRSACWPAGTIRIGLHIGSTGRRQEFGDGQGTKGGTIRAVHRLTCWGIRPGCPRRGRPSGRRGAIGSAGCRRRTSVRFRPW